MIEGALELPKINYVKFWIGLAIVILVTFLNNIQFAKLFGTSIWPFGTILILASWSRIGLNFVILTSIFILGLVQDIILGQTIGLFASINILAFAILFFSKDSLPPAAKNSLYEGILSAISFLVALIFVGLIFNNIPNIFGLIIPIISSIALLYFSKKFFEVMVEKP